MIKKSKTISHYILFMLLLLLLSCNKSTKNIDWTKYKLKGKVKSIREKTYSVSNSNTNKWVGEPQRLISFNTNGNATLYIVFEVDGRMKYKTTTNYYDNYSIDSTFDSNNNFNYILKRIYNDEGLMTSSHRYTKSDNKDENQFNVGYKYDGNDNLIEEVEYDSKFRSKKEYKYIANKLTELREYNSSNQCEGYETYEYDQNGNNIKSKYYNFYARKFTYLWTYQYNNLGNIVQAISNNLSKAEIFISKISYEYDKNENWTKKKSESDAGQDLITRKITYY